MHLKASRASPFCQYDPPKQKCKAVWPGRGQASRRQWVNLAPGCPCLTVRQRACICSFACLCFSGVQLFTENLAAPSISFLTQNFHLKSRNLLTKPQSTAVKVRLKTPRNIFGQTYLCSTMNSRAVGSKRSLGGQI